MPTLSDIAKTQQTTSVSNAPTQNINAGGGANIQAGKNIDNTAALIRDIGVQGNQMAKEVNRASEYAGVVSGTENLAYFTEGMKNIDKMYKDKEVQGGLTAEDMEQRSIAEKNLYNAHLTRGAFGDNAVANDAFKKSYLKNATSHLFKQDSFNTKKRNELILKEELTRTQDLVQWGGTSFDAVNMDERRAAISSVNGNPDEADDMWANTLITKFKERWHSNKPLFVGENAKKEINDIFQHAIKINAEGEYEKVDPNLTDAAEAKMIRAIGLMRDSVGRETNSANEKKHVETVKKTSDRQKDGELTNPITLQAMAESLNFFENAKNNGTFSGEKFKTMKQAYDNLLEHENKMYVVSSYFDKDGNIEDPDVFRELTVEGLDGYLPKVSQIGSAVDRIDANIFKAYGEQKASEANTDMQMQKINNSKDIAEFERKFIKARNLSNAVSSTEPKFVQELNNRLNGSLSTNISKDTAFKLRASMELTGLSLKEPKVYHAIKDYTEVLADKDRESEHKDAMSNINAILQNNHSDIKPKVSDITSGMLEIFQDKAERGNNSTFHIGSARMLAEALYQDGLSEDMALDDARNRETFDLSTYKGFIKISGAGTDKNLVLPRNVSTKDAQAIIDIYTKEKDISEAQIYIVPEVIGRTGERDISWSLMYERGDGKLETLGAINTETYDMYKNKKFKSVKTKEAQEAIDKKREDNRFLGL